jgi:hypothetical protein
MFICCSSNRQHKVKNYLPYIVIDSIEMCKILGFHGSDYEECHLLGCYTLWVL